MKFKKISLLSLLLICGLLVTACDNGGNSGGTDNPNTPTVVEPPSGDDPDDTKTDDTEPGIQEPDTGDDGGDDGDGGDNNPDNPDNPDDDPDPDTGGGGDGGDNPDTEPGPEEGGDGDGGDDNPDDNPDPGTGGEESKYPIAQSYSYALTNQDVKNASSSGSSYTSNGLTWTYTFDEDNVTISSFDSTKGGHIGTTSKYTTEESPFVITCDFGETVYLDAITLYVGTGNNNAASLHVTFESVSFNTKSYVSTSDNPVIPVAYSDIDLEGNVISIEMYSTSKQPIYLRAIAIDVHTTDDTSLELVNNPDYPTVDGNTEFDEPTIEDKIVEAPDDPDDYTTYNSYSHPWDSSEFEYVDDPDAIRTTAVGGLEWAYTMPATKITNDGQSGRGITIGNTTSPQETYWTISTDFDGETVRLEDCALYLYTATSGSGEYSVWFNGEELETDSFNTSGTLDSDVCIIELSDLNLWGGSLRIMLKTSTGTALYFKGITLNILTKEDSKLNLEFEDVFPPYEPHEIIPGEDGVKATEYNPEDVTTDKFYEGVDLTLTGTELQEEINEKCQPQTYYSYGDVRYMFPYTDEDPDNIGYMYGMYDGDKMPAYWDSSRYDREHVWACSHMRLEVKNDDITDFRPSNTDKGHYSDIHNLRVCCKPVNTSKNDKYFGDVTDTNNFFANVTDPDAIGQGKHSLDGDRTGDHRGDGARCCLYMYCIYGIYNGEEGLKLEDGLINGDDQAYFSYGQLTTIVKWAIEDQPDEFEIQRNNRIAEYQGNRNPFIDYPDLVKQLFPDIVENLSL